MTPKRIKIILHSEEQKWRNNVLGNIEVDIGRKTRQAKSSTGGKGVKSLCSTL